MLANNYKKLMNYTIEQGKHSADKDHTIMTWGTLSVDKTVKCVTWVTFYSYCIAMYTGVFDEDFHKWVHSAEHLIAYKQDTGSVRDSLEEVTHWELQGKVILDISPFRTGSESFWFRITSMVPLSISQVKGLMKLSIERAVDYLDSDKKEYENDYEWIPFARPVSCGQYDFHNKIRAIKDMKDINLDRLEIQEKIFKSEHTSAYVCDLRFLKPKLEWANNMVTFSPDFSYRLSELIEKELPQKLPGSIAIVWTFGCMTWMYLCISSATWDTRDIAAIHKLIIEILRENLVTWALTPEEQLQFDTLIKNYDLYAG